MFQSFSARRTVSAGPGTFLHGVPALHLMLLALAALLGAGSAGAQELPLRAPAAEDGSAAPANTRAANWLYILQPADATQPADQPRSDPYYLTTNWDFEQVDLSLLQQRLAQIGLELPFPVSGVITAELTIQVPVGALADARAYRVAGNFTSEELAVAGLVLHNFDAVLDYREGSLELRELEFDVADLQNGQLVLEQAGRFAGTARLRLIPSGDFRAELGFTRIPLVRLQESFPDLSLIHRGRATGQLQARVPVRQLSVVDAWQATGQITLDEASFYGLPTVDATADYRLNAGILAVQQLQAQMQQALLVGSGQVQLANPYPTTARLTLNLPDLGQLANLRPDLALPVPLAGRAQLEANVTAELAPLQLEIRGQGVANEVQVARADVSSARFGYVADLATLQITDLVASLYGGTAIADLDVQFGAEPARTRVQASWQQLDVRQLLNEFPEVTLDAGGLSRGELVVSFPLEAVRDPATWEGAAQVAIDNGQLYGWNRVQLGSEWMLGAGQLRATRLQAMSDVRALELNGSVQLAESLPFNVNLRLQNFALELLNTLPESVRPDPPVAGLVNTQGNFRGLLSPWQLQEATGQLSGRNLDVNEFEIPAAQTNFTVAPQEVRYTGFQAALYGGTVAGTLHWPRVPNQPGAADLAWTNVRIGELLRRTPLPAIGVEGPSSGALQMQMPPDHLFDPAFWNGTLQAAVEQADLFGVPVRRLETQMRLAEQVVHLEPLEGLIREGTFALAGQVGSTEPYGYDLQLTVARVPLVDIQSLCEAIDLPQAEGGYLDGTARFTGSSVPFAIRGAGEARLRELVIAGVQVPHAQSPFRLTPEAAELDGFTAEWYDGTASGSLSFPLTDAGRGSVRATWQAVDLGQLVADLRPLDFPLQAISRGELVADWPAETLVGEGADWTASFEIPQVNVAGATLAQITTARVTLGNQSVAVEARGSALDGQLLASFSLPLGPASGWQAAGQVALTRLDLRRLATISPRLEPLAGRLDLRVQFAPADDELYEGLGVLALEGLQWNTLVLAERLTGRVRLTPELLLLEDFTGALAGGRLRFSGGVSLGSPYPTPMQLSLVGARLGELLAPWPDAADQVQGITDIELRGVVGPVTRAAGHIGLRDARVASFDLRGLRAPLEVLYDSRREQAVVQLRQLMARMARGRVSGNAELVWSRSLQMETDLRFVSVELRELLRGLGQDPRWGSGEVTGRLQLSGRRVESLRDLRGTIQAELGDAQALGLPVLRQVQPYLPGTSSSTQFHSGQLQAQLANGVLRIQELTLSSRDLFLFIGGTITTEQRLSLDVAASTGQLRQERRLAPVLLNQFARFGPPPVALLTTASDLLSDRIIYLDVGGTIRNPVIRLRPVPTLREEAIRYFLRSAMSSP